MLVQESGQIRFVAVGVVYEDHDLHVLPGHKDGTLGCHIDDGKVFSAYHAKYGKELKGKFENSCVSFITRNTALRLIYTELAYAEKYCRLTRMTIMRTNLR